MTNTLANNVFKEIHERVRRGEKADYIIVDTDTLFEIKKHKEYVPYFLQVEVGKGDTFIGLKLAVRVDIDCGWEIR